MERRPGVFTYDAQWPIYALGWSARRDKKHRLAIGSFLEEHSNKVELVQLNQDTFDYSNGSALVFDHPYSPTKLMFFPTEDTLNPDIIATSGDYLRLWEIHEDRIELRTLLDGNKDSEFDSAVTSFDWPEFDPRRVVACSNDTTCTIWDLEKEAVEAQLVAHDKEVYDVSWGGPGVFASVSADGSVRVFDMRDKERSTIIYENSRSGSTPLLRLEWNKADPKVIATVGMDSNKVVILDIRFPAYPLMELRRHRGSVNAIAWSPHVGRQLCSVGDDSRAFIWEVPVAEGRPESGDDIEPVMWYGTTAEIIQDSLGRADVQQLQALRWALRAV
uniref:WD repeat-containing protein LWD1 n=1 Tax=Nelumbo nucifera TaxID=4432 RepID=A0A822ZFA2_NELNU|nr:TPA_asm: hypothetical protein HUJ06_001787 [Nelumbo nucifera]